MTPARAVLLTQASRPALLASRRARPTGVRKRVDVSCEAMRHLLIPNGDGDGSHLNFTFENVAVDVIELAEGTYEVGREAETAEICLPVPTVSSRHALIRLSGDDSLTLTDLGSTNGTYVNGKELDRDVEYVVKGSDEIVFGDDHLASFIYDVSVKD